ncbi:hypothetical protein F441_13554 [Phytophthora nicotianae CJ01A1]|uniref:Uncharacterized protein n=1 Tax=Phytophthora nicotianae CJ01A1 TaxID=1317063 RepID=W2WMT0_PHYNI|nr:hypothetical protein F441_13554 [Phytophthora nicotianae CJ01A1]
MDLQLSLFDAFSRQAFSKDDKLDDGEKIDQVEIDRVRAQDPDSLAFFQAVVLLSGVLEMMHVDELNVDKWHCHLSTFKTLDIPHMIFHTRSSVCHCGIQMILCGISCAEYLAFSENKEREEAHIARLD